MFDHHIHVYLFVLAAEAGHARQVRQHVLRTIQRRLKIRQRTRLASSTRS